MGAYRPEAAFWNLPTISFDLAKSRHTKSIISNVEQSLIIVHSAIDCPDLRGVL